MGPTATTMGAPAQDMVEDSNLRRSQSFPPAKTGVISDVKNMQRLSMIPSAYFSQKEEALSPGELCSGGPFPTSMPLGRMLTTVFLTSETWTRLSTRIYAYRGQ